MVCAVIRNPGTRCTGCDAPRQGGCHTAEDDEENEAFADIPVIMETAKGSEYDKIQSLDLGADDYLVKPFGIMEMVSRVKAVLRRCKPKGSPNLLKLDGLVLNPAEHKERIFERFYRVDKSHSKASVGTGLGLSIVKHAAAYHNAEINLKSTPGKGTIITIRF